MSIKLSPDQDNALNQILDWYLGETKQTLTMGGYAGTGKTTILNEFRKRFRGRIAFLSLTGKAVMTCRKSEKEILDEFLTLWATESLVIAHNLAFDAQMISIAIARYYGQGQVLDAWLKAEGDCTMKGFRSCLNKYYENNPKPPGRMKTNLKEAYAYFTGEDLEDHHSANRDAVAVMEIWFGIQETLGHE